MNINPELDAMGHCTHIIVCFRFRVENRQSIVGSIGCTRAELDLKSQVYHISHKPPTSTIIFPTHQLSQSVLKFGSSVLLLALTTHRLPFFESYIWLLLLFETSMVDTGDVLSCWLRLPCPMPHEPHIVVWIIVWPKQTL